MNREQAIKVLREQDRKGKYIFSNRDLHKFFPEDSFKTFNEGLKRLVKSGILKHACRNVYINEESRQFDSYTIERIAKTLRRGEYNYVSLESMLSEYGIISQIPMDRITIMTTGRKGNYNTAYGVIEFTHTKRPVKNILEGTSKVNERPLRMALKKTALRDLKRVGRNINLINPEELA
jgi:predicted transcriptional regulator of viral defense system